MTEIKLALLTGACLTMPMTLHAQDRITDTRAATPALPPVAGAAPEAPSDQAPAAKTITTLEEAITLAYWTNPSLLAERATLRSTDATYPAARSSYGPQITFNARHEFAHDRFEQPAGNFLGDQGFSSTASLVLSQPLFSFGRRSAAESSSLARIAFGRNQMRVTEARTMLDVITDYVSIIRDREVLAIARDNLALLERQYADSVTRFSVREITSTDLQQVETRVEIGRAQVLSSLGQLGASQSRFAQSIGALPGDLAPPTPLSLGLATLQDAYQLAERNSPIIQAAQAREKVSRAELTIARADRLPEIGLQASGTYGTVTPYQDALRTTEARAAVVLSVPLVDSGLRRSRVEQAQQANDADWQLIDAAIRDVHQSVAAAWDFHQSNLLSLEHFRHASIAAQRAYDGAVIQEKAGARTTLDVLDLARDLLNVRTNYALTQANEYVARANLLTTIGNLEGPLLVRAITGYNPEENFEDQKTRGDVPLLTQVLSGLDSIAVGSDLETDRPTRDAAGRLRVQSVVTPR